MFKKEEGLTYIAMIFIIIFIALIVFGAIYFVRMQISKEALETLKTNLLLIQGKTEIVSQHVDMREKDAKLTGTKLTDMKEDEVIKAFLEKQIIDSESKDSDFYVLTQQDLRDLELENIKEEIVKDLEKVNNLNELNDVKVKYLGKSGVITELQSKIREAEDKKAYGMYVNEIKTYFNEAFTKKNDEINNKIINEKLEGEKIDVTLPGVCIKCGAPNILEKTIEEVEQLFMSLGFDVVDGPEIEEDKYNFELLNIPKGHPARDAQDTFYIVNDEVLLRSQTSPVQARTMLKGNGETPIRMICPGKTYRRDDDDATHSHQFMQIEGLVVDKEISLSDLKGIFDLLAKKLFGENCVTRFRPSYYQFTEPSVETDISCFACNGKGCSLCKNTGWITVAGAGIVHPNVLKNCGYDPNKWTGFAFGFGAERLAMLKYNINDIRTFYTADLREVQVFDRKEN